jgi:hypothetical protein
MATINPHAPREIQVWQVANVLHANIPRSVLRAPQIVEHRPNDKKRDVGPNEFADLALNILNLLMPPQRDLGGDFEPVKCFRGHCSAFAARHHAEFAREFVAMLPAGGGALRTADIEHWIDQRDKEAPGPRGIALSA